MAWQGMVWHTGLESGDLVAELFPDVVPAMQHWVSSGEPWHPAARRLQSPPSAELNRFTFWRQGLHLCMGSWWSMPVPEQHDARSGHARQACVGL